MDYFTSHELEQMKGEKEIIKGAIEANKIAFKRKLEGEFGKNMMEELNHPTKPSFWVGMKYRIKRWRTIRKCNREERKLKKGGF